MFCCGCGIIGINRGFVHESLFEADAFAFFKIDSRNNKHGFKI